MLKKSNILCCGGLQLLISPGPPPSSLSFSAGSRVNRQQQQQQPRSSQTCRSITTAHSNSHDDLSWPATTPFTPYDIFRQRRNAPYSKGRYYELVKIYHPDRPCNGHPLCKDISPEDRVHRYRLVVAAHEILSDPVKRAAYDRFGVGWNYRTGATNEPAVPPWARAGVNYGHNAAYANATWEDWEDYYNRQEGRTQQSTDQRTFATFVILLALIGGTVQLSMIGRYNTGYEQRIREVNERSTRFLTGRRQGSVDQRPSTDARVKQFLMHRDPTGYGLKEGEQKVYKEVLRNDEAASAAGVNKAMQQADQVADPRIDGNP